MESHQRDLKKTKQLAAQLLELCQTAALALPEDLKDACRELEQRCEESTFRVVVLGMFSRGKSTFLNALIGRRLLYESDREATGAITLLRNSPRCTVEVHSPGGTERFPLDEQSYDKIRERVDRNNKNSSATRVLVECPLENFDEDVVFVDTPGLNGLGEEQARVTRQAMDQADAVIFLVLPKSLEAVELSLLRGENPYIGKLRTKNLLFVMTKTGPVLEGVPPGQEEEKLDRFREEIRRQIRQNGLEDAFRDAEIHAVDSRDFLQAVDDAFYARMLHPEGSPSREELRRRSRFDAFRQVLARRLERGNRARQLQSGMTDLMLDICEMLQNAAQSQLTEWKQAGAERRRELEEKQDRHAETKLRLFQRIRKYIREQAEELNDGIELDSARLLAAIQKDADDYIYRRFTREEDFCPSGYRQLTEQLRLWAGGASKTMADDVNKVYRSLTGQISQFTEQNIRETFGLSSSAAYALEPVSIERRQVQDVSLSDAEKELEQEICAAREALSAVDRKTDALTQTLRELERQHQAREREVEDLHRREMRAMGKRPSPEVKHQTRYRTVKAFLWFTREEAYDEAYLDYTRVEAYDRRYKAEQKRYDQDREALRQGQSRIDQGNQELARLEREKMTSQKELESMLTEQELYSRHRQERRRREKAKLLDRQKEELTLICHERLAGAFRQLNSAIVAKNAAAVERLTQTADRLLEEAQARYLALLQEQLREQDRTSYEDLEELIKQVESFQREMGEESAE